MSPVQTAQPLSPPPHHRAAKPGWREHCYSALYHHGTVLARRVDLTLAALIAISILVVILDGVLPIHRAWAGWFRTVEWLIVTSVLIFIGYSVIAVPTGVHNAELSHSMRPAEAGQRHFDNRSCSGCGRIGHEAGARHCSQWGHPLDNPMNSSR